MQFRKDYIPELDGIRALAVLMVMWVHLPDVALGGWIGNLGYHLHFGIIGVDLFFVLSGFLITRILLVDREAGAPLRHFLYRRFLRIFPIYYLLLLILSPLMPWDQILYCATYTTNYGLLYVDTGSRLEHAWSLAIEEHFYIIWPPIAVWFAPKASRRVLLFLVFPLSIGSILFALFWAPWSAQLPNALDWMYRGSTVRFGSLGLGALMAYHENWIRKSHVQVGLLAGLLVAITVLVSDKFLRWSEVAVWIHSYPVDERPGFYYRTMHALRMIMTPFTSAAIILIALTTSGMRTPWGVLYRLVLLRWIGRISYGLYLYHFPIYRYMRRHYADPKDPTDVEILLAVLATFAVAIVSYLVIERPIMRFGKRFRLPETPPESGAEPGPSRS